jgi:hypothetical protein
LISHFYFFPKYFGHGVPKIAFGHEAARRRNLTAACLAYLKVSELYPNVAMKLCDQIDDCRTAQDVYNKAKILIDRFPVEMTSEASTAFASWNKKSNRQNDKKPTIESTLQSISDRLKNLEDKNDEVKGDNQTKKQNKGNKWQGNKQTEARAAETSEAESSLVPSYANFRISE